VKTARTHVIYIFGFLAPVAACAQALTLDSPHDYEVFQRQTFEDGNVLLSGSVPPDGGRVETRLAGSKNNKWLPVPVNQNAHIFRTMLPVPAGGWYSLEVRLLKGHKVVAQTDVPHVGVGEVFVIAGQSNSTNYGEVKQQTGSGMVAAFSGAAWQIANDPQPGVQDNSTKGSFIPSFGDAMYARYHLPIGVACVGHGSTSVRQWLPKGDPIDVPPTMGKYVIQIGPTEWRSTGQLFDGMVIRMKTTSQTGSIKAGFVPGVGHGFGFEVVRETLGTFRYNSIGSFVKGGAYHTYGWVDPAKDLVGIIFMQRTNGGGDVADEIDSFMAMSVAAIGSLNITVRRCRVVREIKCVHESHQATREPRYQDRPGRLSLSSERVGHSDKARSRFATPQRLSPSAASSAQNLSPSDLVVFRSLPPRKDRNTDELRQASLRSQSRRARRVRVCWRKSLLVSCIIPLDRWRHTLSIRRVEYDIERESKALG
jgi:hypothetical protein